MKAYFYSILLGILATCQEFECTPGQPCWPSKEEWATFNNTISGRLRVTTPLASPCYTSSLDYDVAACNVVMQNYGNGTYRSLVYGATGKLNWEECGPAQCQLNVSDTILNPNGNVCQLGALSAYYVAAVIAEDVQETLAFVDRHRLRLSIKNTGHGSLARNVAPDSLALWVFNMKDLAFHSDFKASNCPGANAPNVGEIGAGVTSREAAEFFAQYGMDVTTSGYDYIGAAGGFGMGGGHGPFAPSYGLMVDQAVEFEVVTADGQLRTINQCNEPELFYALRGGGGSTYAVIISYKAKVYPSKLLHFYSFVANITNPSDLEFTQSHILPGVFESYIANQPIWSDNNVAGWHFLRRLSIEFYLLLPSSQDQTLFQNMTAQFRRDLGAVQGITTLVDQFTSFQAFPEFLDAWAVVAETHNYPGVGSQEATRMVPRSLFDLQETHMDYTLRNALLQGAKEAFANDIGMELVASMPTSHPDNSATGVNPAFRNALAQVIWPFAQRVMNPPLRTPALQIIEKANNFLKDITPGGGNNMYEADWNEPDWKQAFFGDNYDRLLQIKNKYDPHGLFDCFKCVGWTGYNNSRYSCFTNSPKATIA